MNKDPWATHGHLRLVWNRDWVMQWHELLSGQDFVGAILRSAMEAAENPNRGPLPAEEMEAFRKQVDAFR
jgi:hypothetical protein